MNELQDQIFFLSLGLCKLIHQFDYDNSKVYVNHHNTKKNNQFDRSRFRSYMIDSFQSLEMISQQLNCP